MIHVFHGELLEASRQELTKLKQQYQSAEIIEIDGKKAELTNLVQASESASLLAKKRVVIVENYISQQISKSKLLKQTFHQFLNQYQFETTLVFWEDKKLPKTLLALFPANTDIALFQPQKSIFSFVESIKPGNVRIMLEKMELAIEFDAPELIFTMLVRQIRLLIQVSETNGQGLNLASWQKSRLHKQAREFTPYQLRQIYTCLLDIDMKVKQSLTPFSLLQELRLFLANL